MITYFLNEGNTLLSVYLVQSQDYDYYACQQLPTNVPLLGGVVGRSWKVNQSELPIPACSKRESESPMAQNSCATVYSCARLRVHIESQRRKSGFACLGAAHQAQGCLPFRQVLPDFVQPCSR